MTIINKNTIGKVTTKLLVYLSYQYIYLITIAFTSLRDTLLPKPMSDNVKLKNLKT